MSSMQITLLVFSPFILYFAVHIISDAWHRGKNKHRKENKDGKQQTEKKHGRQDQKSS